jgi:hypothetical protein
MGIDSGLPAEVRRVEAETGIRVSRCRPLNWKREQTTPLYLLDTPDGRFVVKSADAFPSWRRRLGRLLGDWELGWQAQVYACLDEQHFEHFRFPRLVATDGRTYLLLEYLETRQHGEHDIPREVLLNSLLELQLAHVTFEGPRLQKLLAATKTPTTALTRRVLLGVQSRFGGTVARRGAAVIWHCLRTQPPLDRRVVCHNDLHHNNLLLGSDGSLYISDFEQVSLDDRWVLADIIHYAVGTNRFAVDTSIISDYIDLLRHATRFELNLGSQVRFGLLLRVSKLVLSRVPPADVAQEYGRFLVEVLLDDVAYASWFEANFRGPLLRPRSEVRSA